MGRKRLMRSSIIILVALFIGINTVCAASAMESPISSITSVNNLNKSSSVLGLLNHSVVYNGNGSTGGSVPIDNNIYYNGATVIMLGNTGNLVENGNPFAGWNTAADGSGTTYLPGATLTMGTTNVTLYAQWSPWTVVSNTGFWSFPWGIAVDGSGDIYAAEVGAAPNAGLGGAEELVSGGSSWTLIKAPVGLKGCYIPWDVAVDGSGDTYLAYKSYDKVMELTNGNAFTVDLTSNGNFNFPNGPQGVAVDGSGNVYVTDTGNNKTKELKKGSTSWKDITNSGGFSQPSGIAVDSSGDVYVADSGNNAIKELQKGNVFWTDISSNGGFGGSSQVWDSISGNAITYNGPQGIAVDSSGNVYVADSGNNAVKELKKGSTSWIDITDNGNFASPCGVAVDSSGNLYVADTNNCEIKELKLAATDTGIASPSAARKVMLFVIGSTDYTVNGQSQPMDTAPVILDGVTMLPVKYVAAALGASVSSDQAQHEVTVGLGGKTIELWIGRSTANVNGTATPIDPDNPGVSPFIANGRTMLPLRFIAENLGCQVGWDKDTSQVTLTYPAS